ncbi:MAG: hypothetical protein IKG87_03915 [Clostridia bacterium]|nr:hypothetical protein [Clostridia bacterium]MBR4577068.1 hypothetical protein [Clostridia bacterium]
MLRLLGLLALGNMIFGGNRHRRRNGSFLGGLFILPALMFGGWFALALIGGVLGLMGSVIGGIFSGLEALASGAFSGSGVLGGIVIGLALYFGLKKKNEARKEESGSTVDGEAVETEIVEPQYHHMND